MGNVSSPDAKQVGKAKYKDRSHINPIRAKPVNAKRWNIDCYDLFDKHDYPGKFIIFNHFEFDCHLGLDDREGTEKDVERVEETMETLGFQEAAICQTDLAFDAIKTTLNEVLKQDFTKYGSIIVVILTHGKLRQLWAKDKAYDIEEIKKLFIENDAATKLAKKPKIFLIQACQGKEADDGVNASPEVGSSGNDSGSDENGITIPIMADFLTAISSAPGYLSFRRRNVGSWFIQALCDAIEEFRNTKDFENILTLVKYDIAYNKTSNNPNYKKLHNKKQIPEVTSTLTKTLYLTKEAKLNAI